VAFHGSVGSFLLQNFENTSEKPPKKEEKVKITGT
jgi:hypothetical protein